MRRGREIKERGGEKNIKKENGKRKSKNRKTVEEEEEEEEESICLENNFCQLIKNTHSHRKQVDIYKS